MEQDEINDKDIDDSPNGLNSQSTSVSDCDRGMSSDDLRQFDVLDDLERHDDDDQDGSEYETDSDESMDSDVPDDEIEAMLEEGTT